MSVAVELKSQCDSSLAEKSTELLNSMDSVPVDDASGEKASTEVVGRCKVCNHPFTIRGFVLKMRDRDPRLCYPFRLKGSSELWKELPPMVVPDAKYWRCPVCVPEDEWDVLKDLFGMSNKVTQKRDEAQGVAVPVVVQSSKVTNTGVRITEVSATTDSKDNRNCSPTTNVCADIKGKGKAHVEVDLPTYTGFLNGFLKNSSSLGIQKQTADDIKACSSDGKVYETEKGRHNSQALSDDHCVEAPIHGVTADMPGIVSRHCSQRLQVNLPDLNECSGEPLYEENNEKVVTENNVSNLCEDDDDYLGAERRKKPKVRLLSELLGLKESQFPAKAKKKNSSSFVSLDENIKRKRMGSQDEESQCMEIKGSNTGTKKVVETIEIFDSESENGSDSDNVSTEKISDALSKKRCKSRDLLFEKRNKKIKVDNGESSSISRQKVKPKSIHNNRKSLDLPQKHDVSAQLSERNSVLTKKRGKVLQARKEIPCLVPCKSRMPPESGAIQKDKQPEQNGTNNVQNEFAKSHQIASNNLCKDNDKPCFPLRKGGSYAPPSQAEPALIDGNSIQKYKQNGNIGEINIAFRTTAADISNTADQSDENGERSNDIKTNPKKNTAGIPEAEGHSPLSQQIPLQAPNSAVNHNALDNETRGRVQDIDINSIPMDDKTNEQGLGDEIPMDIVELMAKNQYERHLDDPKDKHNIPAPPALTGTFIRHDGVCGSLGQRMQDFAQPHFLSIKKPLSLDNRNSVVNGSWGHLSDLNNNPLGARGLPREIPVSTRFFSPSQSQERISSYSSRGLAPNNWNGNIHMAGERPPPSFLQKMGSYTKYRPIAPQQSATETSQVWASVMTSRMPLGITNPQMLSQSSKVLNRENIHPQCPGSMFSLSSAATHTGKQQILNFSNVYNSGHPESSAGRVDVNDDSIPAMQLLGLGHSNENSQDTDLSLGRQKTTELNSSRQPFIKSMGRPSAMQDNRHPCYPIALPTSRPFAPTFPHNGANIGRFGVGFSGAIPLTSQGQRNLEGSHFAPPGGKSQPLRQLMGPPIDKGIAPMALSLDKGKGIASMAFSLDKSKGIAPMALSVDKGKGLASMAFSLNKGKGRAPMALPLDKGKAIASIPSRLDKGKGIASMPSPLDKGKGIASRSTLSFGNAFPVRKYSANVRPRAGARRDRKRFSPSYDRRICQLNRNPSEFTDLKLAQSFMYGAAELRRKGSPHERTPKPKRSAKKSESSGSKPGPSGSKRRNQPKQGP